MKKVIRDNRGYSIGWTNTTAKKGTFNEFCDKTNYSHNGCIAETMKSLDNNEDKYIKLYIEEQGELY